MPNENKIIWAKPVTIEDLNRGEKKTIHHSLGISFTSIGPDFLEATMPVDDRTRQHLGLLHGGASVVLAESLGSCASFLVVNRPCVGINIHANHMRAMLEGTVLGRATPLRIGRTLHVWHIRIVDAAQPSKVVCESTLSVMVKTDAN